MSKRSLGTLKTSGLLFVGGFLLMGLLAGVGTLGKHADAERSAARVEASDTTARQQR